MAKLLTLKDNFNDDSFDTSKWTKFEFTDSGTTSINETNNRVEFSFTPGYSDGYFISNDTFDFTDSQAMLEVPYFPQTGNLVIYLAVSQLTSPYSEFKFMLQGTTLRAYLNYEGFPQLLLRTQTYDPVMHKWLRIRESSNNIYWDTSPDSNTWTNLTPLNNHGRSITSVQPYIYGSASGISSSQTIAIDNFNYQVVSVINTLQGGSSFTLSPDLVFYVSLNIEGSSSLTARGAALADQSQVDKTYLYKPYDADDNFLGVWKDVKSELTFDHELYSAGSAIQVELARNSDSKVVQLEDLSTTSSEDITTQDSNTLVIGLETTNAVGPGSNVDVNYRVEVWVFYGEITDISTTSEEIILTQDGENIQINYGAVNGLRKFHGFISRYNSRYGSNETTLVTILSFGRDLDHYVLENGTATTVSYSSQDPSNIAKDALDKFTAAGGLVDYNASSIVLTGTSVTYTFRLNTYLEVLKKCVELAPYDWYWFVGLGDDLVYMAAKPTTPAHTFILGKHIQVLDVEYSIEDITNKVYFTGGEVSAETNLFKKYTDSTSISNYRQGLQRISDHRVTLDTSATLIAEAEIDRNSIPRYKSTITILENVYNTEEIALGQLVTFRNFGNYIDDLELQIVGLSYHPDYVTLQLDTLLPSVNKRIEDLRRNMVELDNEQTPTTPS